MKEMERRLLLVIVLLLLGIASVWLLNGPDKQEIVPSLSGNGETISAQMQDQGEELQEGAELAAPPPQPRRD